MDVIVSKYLKSRLGASTFAEIQYLNQDRPSPEAGDHRLPTAPAKLHQ